LQASSFASTPSVRGEASALGVERFAQTEVVDDGWMELVGERVNVFAQPNELLAHRPVEHVPGHPGSSTLHARRVDREPCETLAEIVVELPREAAPFVLMGGEQAPTQVTPLLFGGAPAGTLHEEPGDERRLERDDRDGGENGAPVLLPRRSRPEPDGTPGGKEALVNRPTLELAVVVFGRSHRHRLDLNVLGCLAAQDSERRVARPAARLGQGHERPAHDSAAELGIEEAEDRGVRGGVQDVERLVPLPRDARGIDGQSAVENGGIRRKRHHALLNFREGEVEEPGETDAVFERLEITLGLLEPEPSEPGVAGDDDDLFRIGENPENVLDLPGQIDHDRHGRGMGQRRRSLEDAPLEARGEKRRRSEEPVPMTEAKPRRRASDRDDQVEGVVLEKSGEVLDEGVLTRRFVEAGRLEGRLEEFHRCGRPLSQVFLEARSELVERREVPAERVQDEHAFLRLLLHVLRLRRS
jgi:hypothetical protein